MEAVAASRGADLFGSLLKDLLRVVVVSEITHPELTPAKSLSKIVVLQDAI